MFRIYRLIFALALLLPVIVDAMVKVGSGKTDMTPPIGTPSAGYADRKGEGMLGVHDPLFAIALFIDSGKRKIAICSIDHLGFTYEMVQTVIRQVQTVPWLADCEIFIASLHSHSGGGAYLNIPLLASFLSGAYEAEIASFYEDEVAEAIIKSSQNLVPAKIGVGYGKAGRLRCFCYLILNSMAVV